ncbi:histidine kinase N-terminal 7TM domain-containing protein [Roseococcus thiosulfatophilus]|uniref:histidine kinase N-terminal 7TM domain-containing protein n=1 Tax=Roseococcus thiosulfatophilus TaxID=35813 RepID=UPI001A8D4EDB|nr:histidine kinase N-terminal 7TM domain-containing protein [Roseococcus thiosulfatophilus]
MLTGCAFTTPGAAELTVVAVWLGVATVTSWVLRQHPFFGRPHFILCNFAMLWWLAMVLGELATPVMGCKMFFAAAAWPAIALLPTAWALFLLHYCFHMPIRHRGTEAVLLWGTVLAVSLMAWTNPWHGLFYGPGTALAWTDGRLSGVFDHGPLFYIAAAWLYVPLLTALGVVLAGAFRAPVAHRPYFLLLLFITAIPLAANFAYITHGATVAGFDPTPFAFAAVLVLYTGLIFTNRMFDLTAIARDVLYYQLGSPVLVLDVAGTVTGANPEAMRLFPGGRVGQPIWQWPHMQGFGAAAEGMDAPASLGFDGRFFDVTTTPIHKPLGQGRGLIGAVIMLNDTTELRRNARQLETALEISQLRLHEIENQRRLLRNLFDLAPFGITLVETATGRLREVNPTFAGMTAHAATPGGKLSDLLSIPGRAALAEAATLPEGGRVGPVVTEIRRRDGGFVMAELQAVAAGAGLYWTILTDLTETRALQEALQSERDFLSRLMATSVSAILAVDDDKQIVFANAEAERLLEMDRAALLATRINDPEWHYTTPEGGPMAQEDLPFPVVMRTGRPVRDLRLGVEGPDGRRRILSVNAAPMHATALTPGRVVLSLTDITAQWEGQAALVAARQEAEAASIAKSRFLANMSHEIRTPMNAILGLLALLRRTSLDARQADYVGKTEGAARALLGLLNDILDFSKVEAGKIALDPRPVSLDAMLRELGVILAANLGAKPIELLFDLDPCLPTQVLVDDLRLAQVLLNLAGKAIKFTEAGEVVVSARVLAREAGRARLEFAVRDTGIGIAADNMPRIFEGFLQAEASTTRKFGGTGLGLGISQRLVALLGGELRVESTPGQGSRFHFALELDLPEAPARLPGPAKRLLFVDPHPAARDILPRLAARLGWRAEAVADVAAARARREAQRYDAVLVEGLRPDTPEAEWEGVLGMGTVHGSEGYIAAGGPPGRFLVKPFTPAQLRELVEGAGALPPRAEARAGTRRLAGRRLLLVEDNVINQQVARELLEAEGALVTVAGHGGIAVQLLTEMPGRFEAVLMDLQMPEMDGLEATALIRGRLGLRQLPIIAITANAMRSDRDACLAAGMNAHVGKPFDLETLVQTLLSCWGAAPAAMPPGEPVALDAPLLDIPAAIARLGDNPDLFAETLREALPMMEATPAEVAAQWQAGAHADARRTAHTLKGLAGMVGAPLLAEAAARLEAQLKARPEDDPAEALDELRSELAPSLAALRAWLDGREG